MQELRRTFEGKPFGPILIEEPITYITFCESKIETLQCHLELDESLKVFLYLTSAGIDSHAFDSDEFYKISIGSGDPIDFFDVNTSFDSKGNSDHKLTSTKEPILVSGLNAKTIHGVLVNGPQLHFKKGEVLLLKDSDSEIEIQAFDHADDSFYQSISSHTPPALTHTFLFNSKSANDGLEAFDRIGRIISFLGFIKGTRVGMGQMHGATTGDRSAFKILGFSKSDSIKGPLNWYYRSQSNKLPELYDRYLKRISSISGKKNFGRALSYYKTSNSIRNDSTEVALLVSVAGLESFAYHILTTEGGWQKDLVRRASLSDVLRAAAHFQGIQDDPAGQSDALSAILRRKKDAKGYDGYNLIADFRNGLTHPLDFEYNGKELLHAWFACQWLLEISILAHLKYTGKYQDRRKRTGAWAGQLDDLPIHPSR